MRPCHHQSGVLESIQRHRATAIRIARGWLRRLPPSVERGDIEQAALIGIFEWKSAHPDETAAGWEGGLKARVRGSIVDELRRQDWLPRGLRRVACADDSVRVVGYDDVGLRWEPHWGNADESPEHVLDCKRQVAEALRAPMIDRDAEVVRLHYFGDQMFKDIAERFGCAAPRVTQRHDRAIGVMRARLMGDVRTIRAAERSVTASKARTKGTQQHGHSEFDVPSSGIYPKGCGAVTSTLPDEGVDLRSELGRYQDWMVEQALIRSGGNKAKAARLLGLNRTTLVEMLKGKTRLTIAPPAPERSVVESVAKVAPASSPGLERVSRGEIAKLKAAGKSVLQAARALGVNRWLVDREYKRLEQLGSQPSA